MPRQRTRAAVDGKCRTCGGTDLNARDYCRPCLRVYDRARRATDPEKFRAQERERLRRWRRSNPEKKRAQKLRQEYGLTPEQLAAMLRAQGNACAICRAAAPECIDHCHASGRVRGVLCRLCNSGIGQFGDDPAILLAAADYIEEHRHGRC